MKSRRASVLIGLLWCLALLSVIVVGGLHSARLELQVAKNHGDQIQARYLALAGIEKAKALLYRDIADRKRAAVHHNGQLYDAPAAFQDIALGRGQFRVFRQAQREEARGIVFGLSDEESRLNVNSASSDDLNKLYLMTPDVAAALIDWRDGNNAVTPGGAELDYYASLNPPYRPRNGSFETLPELLLVRGVTRELLFGEDANRNGLLDPEEDDGDTSLPRDNHDGILDHGWVGLLSVQSVAYGQNAAGQDRINVKSADEKELTSVRGITPEIAKAIIAARGQNQLDSLADLLEVTAPAPQNQPAPPAQSSRPSQRSTGPMRDAPTSSGLARTSNRSSGPRLISPELLADIADDITVSDDTVPGAVNINTAGVDVLACLPGLSREVAQAIVAYRKSAGFFANIAGLLKVDGLTPEIFKQVASRVTVRSETFRILSEGRVTSSGARQRIEMVVRYNAETFTTLSYREDL